jgi:hypothetical protein
LIVCTPPVQAQVFGNNQFSGQFNNQPSFQPTNTSALSGNSGGINIIGPSGATNRPFANNNFLNTPNNPSGFNNINNFNNHLNNLSNFNLNNNPSFTNPSNNSSNLFQQSNSSFQSDDSITNDVRRGLISPGLSFNARSASVRTTNGIVTLTGTVANQTEKLQLEQNARGSVGVKSVVNNLMIKP